MVIIQHLLRLIDVYTVLRGVVPRHFHEPVQVGARYGILRGGLRHSRHSAQLSLRLLQHVLRHPDSVYLLPEFIYLRGLVTALPQFLPYRLQLLPEVKLPLRLSHGPFRLGIDLLSQFQYLRFTPEQLVENLESLAHIELCQDLLTLVEVDAQLRCDEIGFLVQNRNRLERREYLLGQVRHQGYNLFEQPLRVLDKGIHLCPLALLGFQPLDPAQRKRIRLDKFLQAYPSDAMHQDLHPPIRHALHPGNLGRGSHRVEVLNPNLASLSPLLSDLLNHRLHLGGFLPENGHYAVPARNRRIH